MFVIDASIALAWCFDDEETRPADAVLARLATEPALVPSIWPLEVANGLWSARRRGRINDADLPRLRSLLGALPVTVDQTSLETSLDDVLAQAIQHEISAYDAAYLWLALERGLPLATGDGRLRAAADRAGVQRIA